MTSVSFLVVAAASTRWTSAGRSTAVAGTAAGTIRDRTTGPAPGRGTVPSGRTSSGAVVKGPPALGLNAGHGSILVAAGGDGITLGGESSGEGEGGATGGGQAVGTRPVPSGAAGREDPSAPGTGGPSSGCGGCS